jgi:hypothetical protein
MKPHSTMTGARAAASSLFLVLLLLFASYRPAVCLLSLTSLQTNPTERAPLFPNQNKPRPSRQQSHATVERATAPQKVEAEPASQRALVTANRAARAAAGISTAPAGALQPDYLKPYLPDLPYNHLSPPV